MNEKHHDWKILLVEDDEDDFLLTREMLSETRGRKSTVVWASSFEEGKLALQSNHFDAVLMDYDLGHKTGLELIRESTAKGYSAPFILLTGRGNYEVDIEAMHAGATLYLTKSEVNSLLLERSIRYAIERKQIEKELRSSRNELQQANNRLNEELAERKRVEANLRYSEERFNKAFKVSPNAQVISRLDNGTILDINDSFGKVFGYSRDEVIGKTSLELNMFMHPEDRQEAINRLRKEKRLRDFELEIRTKSGETRLACLGIEILTVGEDILMLTNVEDITVRRKMEEELRVREAAMDAFFEASPGILNLFDQQLRYIKTDPTTPTYFNHDSFSIIGKSVKELNPPFVEQFLGPIMKRVTETEQPELNLEVPGPIPSRDGEIGYWRVSYFPVPLPEGEVGLGVMGLDITDQKEAQIELQSAHQQTVEILESIQDAFYSLDQKARFTYINKRAANIWAKDPEDLLGKNIWEVFPSGKETEAYKKIQKALVEKIPDQFETYSKYLDQWVEIRLYPTEQGLSVYFQDITERKRMEEELRKSEQKYRKYYEFNQRKLGP